MLIARLLERSARATPAEVERYEDGALLRHTCEPAHWWAGACLLHGHDVAAMVDAAEGFAAGWGARPQVHVCDGCPEGLDDELAARGYHRHTDVIVMTATPAEVLAALDQTTGATITAPLGSVVLTQRPEPDWFGEQTMRMLTRVDALSAYAAVTQHAVAVSVGRAVVDDRWAGVFSMRTRDGSRRRGHARSVLACLARWAADRASGLYLQVRAVDEPARWLYQGTGFTELGRYHYRQAPG